MITFIKNLFKKQEIGCVCKSILEDLEKPESFALVGQTLENNKYSLWVSKYYKDCIEVQLKNGGIIHDVNGNKFFNKREAKAINEKGRVVFNYFKNQEKIENARKKNQALSKVFPQCYNKESSRKKF